MTLVLRADGACAPNQLARPQFFIILAEQAFRNYSLTYTVEEILHTELIMTTPIDKFLEKHARTQPERHDDVSMHRVLGQPLYKVNALRTRLSAFTRKQMEREKRRAEGNAKCPRGSSHYKWKQRKTKEKQARYDDTLKRRWNRLLTNSKSRGIEGPHMSLNEYVKLFTELVPWVSVGEKAVPAIMLMGRGGLGLRRIDETRGFTLDNAQVVYKDSVLWKGTNL